MSAEISSPEHVYLRILSQEEVFHASQAQWVQVPLADGLIGIWPGHAPLIGTLGMGEVEWGTGQGTNTFAVEGGMLCVDTDRCVVLVSRSASPTEEPSPAEALVEHFDQELSEKLSDEEIHKLQER